MELSKKPDLYLIKKVKNCADSAAYLELKKRYEKLYYSTAASYCKKVEKLDYQSLVEDVDLVLLKSINSFDRKKKCKISSYFCNMSRYHVLNTIKSNTEDGHFISTENKDIDFHNQENKNFHLDNNQDLKNHIFNIIDKLKDKERARKIFELRFYGTKEEKKWQYIANQLNLTTQQISNIFNFVKKKIYQEMTKEEYNK